MVINLIPRITELTMYELLIQHQRTEVTVSQLTCNHHLKLEKHLHPQAWPSPTDRIIGVDRMCLKQFPEDRQNWNHQQKHSSRDQNPRSEAVQSGCPNLSICDPKCDCETKKEKKHHNRLQPLLFCSLNILWTDDEIQQPRFYTEESHCGE